MKRIYLALIFFILILIICVKSISSVNNNIKSLYKELDEIKISLNNYDPERALTFTEQRLEEKWQNTCKKFSIFMDHVRLEYVSQAITALKTNLTQKDRLEEAHIELEKIKEYLTQIKNLENPHVYNIF